MILSFKRYLSAIVTAALITGAATSAMAADVPATLTHQGRLFDDAGKPITDSLQITFNFYLAPNDAAPAVSETLDVTLEDGYFSVSLGKVNSIVDLLQSGAPLYLGIAVGNDAEMTPRTIVQSVPYAIVSSNAIGDITPTSVSIGGTEVINSSGQWVGDPTGLVGATGPAGANGMTGMTGPQGPAGANGMTGPQGPMGAMGATGAQGPQGPMGAMGATGAQGPAGPAGPMGATGATGAAGPAGPAGAVGATGPAGPTGIVQVLTSSGNVADPSSLVANTYGRVGASVLATIAANQKVHFVASKFMGSSVAGGANGLNIVPCSQTTVAGSTPAIAGAGKFGGTVVQNTRLDWSIQHVFTGLPAGTYNFSMCVSTPIPANWNLNEFGYAAIIVTN